MGKVISFEKVKKKKKAFNPNKKKSKLAAEKAARDDIRTDAGYIEMEPEEEIEYLKSIEKEEEEKFKTKYKDVLAVVPVTVGAKMQYFGRVGQRYYYRFPL